ncbi:MAG: VOC family protein [Thermomicrobiales bacterium]
MVSIGRTTILVNDLDAAKDFYVDAFGFDTLFDDEVAPGLRTVHVGPDGPRGAGLWLMKATSEAGRARVGAQTSGEPALVFYTDDLTSELARLDAYGVKPIKPPFTNDGGASYAHVRDSSGNEIVLAQLPGQLPPEPPQRPGKPHTIGLIEFPTDNPEQSANFYHALFGWEISPGPYTMFDTGNIKGAFPDMLNGFPPVRAVVQPGDTLVYVDVRDIDAILARARDLGANVLLEKTESAPDHLLAIITDPAGSKIALGQSNWS